MNLEIVTIGTELVLGFTTDTNGAFAGRQLAEVGARVVRRTAVPDAPDAIRAAVASALERTGLVITTGGLGPTRDDITKRIIADLFGASLEFQEALWEDLVTKFARFGRVPAESNRCQAEVPRGALVLPNKRGTAPGIWIRGDPGEVVMLPGVPVEMRGLLVAEVMPRLRQRGGGRAILSRIVRTTGLPESTLGERVGRLEEQLRPLTLAYLPGLEGVDLRLTAWDLAPEKAGEELERGIDLLRSDLGDHCYGLDDDDLAMVLLGALRARGDRLVVAESCTGGMVGERVTAIPGSSSVFLGGVVAYANSAKTQLLGVSDRTIVEDGAVSEAAARAMVEGAVERLGGTAGVSLTGVAGPDGGTPDKPIGTVWFGFLVDGHVEVRRVGFPGTRSEVRARAAQAALHGLWRRVKDMGQ